MSMDSWNPDVVRQHVRRVLQEDVAYANRKMMEVERLESEGHRIVDGGPGDMVDWRTNEVLVPALYDLDEEEFDAAIGKLDPSGTWIHIDCVLEDVVLTELVTPGLPLSLGDAIQEWVESSWHKTEELAVVTGWPIETIVAFRRQVAADVHPKGLVT